MRKEDKMHNFHKFLLLPSNCTPLKRKMLMRIKYLSHAGLNSLHAGYFFMLLLLSADFLAHLSRRLIG